MTLLSLRDDLNFLLSQDDASRPDTIRGVLEDAYALVQISPPEHLREDFFTFGHMLAEAMTQVHDEGVLEEAIILPSRLSPMLTRLDQSNFYVIVARGLLLRYENHSDERALNAAVHMGEYAHRAAPSNVAALTLLSVGMSGEYYESGSLESLARGISLLEQALAASSFEALEKATLLSDLAALHGIRYEATRAKRDCIDSVTYLEEAKGLFEASEADTPPPLEIVANLGSAYHNRYESLGDQQDLRLAIATYTEVLTRLDLIGFQRGAVMVNLNACVLDSYESDHDVRSLHAVGLILDQVLRQVGRSLDRPRGLLLRARWHELSLKAGNDNPDFYRSTINAFHDAADAAEEQALFEMIPVVSRWGSLAFERGDWNEAAEAFSRGTKVMRAAVAANIGRGAKERVIVGFHDFATRGAYALARLGQLEDAAVLAESGRALIFAEELKLDLADSEALRNSSPALYREVAQASQLLRRFCTGGDWALRSEALESLKAIYRKAHSNRGLEAFGDILSIKEIRTVVAESPLAYVLETPVGAAALIVLHRNVQVVWMDALKTADIQGHIEGLALAHEKDEDSFRFELDRILAWLWDAGIGLLHEASAAWKRLRIVACGLLSFLPLHAAWHAMGTTREYLLESIAVSYVPSARFLLQAKARLGADAPSLAICEPFNLNMPALKYAPVEIRGLERAVPGTEALASAEATLAKVAQALQTPRRTVHFACHAQASGAYPLESYLLLANGERLTVQQLSTLGDSQYDVVVLSACESALSGKEMPDESIGLPITFLHIGARCVIGSFWKVLDASTSVLMTEYYEALRSGATEIDALLNAQRSTRFMKVSNISEILGLPPSTNQEAPFTHPYYWAAFALFG